MLQGGGIHELEVVYLLLLLFVVIFALLARKLKHYILTDAPLYQEFAFMIGTVLPADLGNYCLSIDIDGLDPSIAPGTESPEAEGLTFTETKRLWRGIATRGQMAGLDLVEVNPYLDHAELTQHIAVQIIIEAIATKFAA